MQTHATSAARAARHGSAPKPRGKPSSAHAKGDDRLYREALAYARRQRYCKAQELGAELGIGIGAARELILRMQAEGVLGPADMFGTCPLGSGAQPQAVQP